MQEFERQFNAYFEPWHIVLPPQDIARRRHGKIVQAGWAIWYRFDADEKGAYLDFYASHRMTDDRHVRLYASGEMDESLPRIESVRRCSRAPVEDRRLKAEYETHNRAIAKHLAAKGFGIEGDEPMAVQMNRRLRMKTGGTER